MDTVRSGFTVYYEISTRYELIGYERNIVRHCKSRHGKIVKADDCQSPQVVKDCDWTKPRKKLADKFKVKQ